MFEDLILPTDGEIFNDLHAYYRGHIAQVSSTTINQLHVHTENYAEELIKGGLGKTCRHLGAISAIALLDAYNGVKSSKVSPGEVNG